MIFNGRIWLSFHLSCYLDILYQKSKAESLNLKVVIFSGQEYIV